MGPGDSSLATILLTTDCAIVGVLSLSNPSLLASALVGIVCLCLRCDGERTSGNLEDLERDISDYSFGERRSTTMQNAFHRCFCVDNISTSIPPDETIIGLMVRCFVNAPDLTCVGRGRSAWCFVLALFALLGRLFFFSMSVSFGKSPTRRFRKASSCGSHSRSCQHLLF